MRVWLHGFHHNSQINTFLELQNSSQVTIGEWVARNNHATISDQDFKHVRLPVRQYVPKKMDDYREFFRSYFTVFSSSFSRTPKGMGVPPGDIENAFWMYTDFIHQTLRNKSIELVIFSDIPHLGGDYLVYACAKQLGIKTLICSQSQYPDRFFYFTDIESYGLLNPDLPRNPLPEYVTVERVFRKYFFYMSGIDPEYRSCIYAFLKEIKRIVRRKHSRKTPLTALTKLVRCHQFKKRYNQCLSNSFNLDKPFVYFPLQLQPELTTDILGGLFADQSLAIERLRALIPDDWQIIVKENPKQLEFKRGEYFFDRMKKIANTHYVSKKVDTYELMEKSQFTATITGSVGWESITGGKPTVIFGKTWYRSLPGVIEYRDDLTINEIQDINIEHQKLEAAYNELLAQTGSGLVNLQYRKIVLNYSDDDNTKNLVKSFALILRTLCE